jgi:hypothetical protein
VQAVANYSNHETYPPVGSGFSPPLKRSKMRRTKALFTSADTTGDPPPLLPTQ